MNKTIKPILAISLMAILLAPLGGCNQSPPPGNGEHNSTSSPSPSPSPSTLPATTPPTWDTVKQQLDEIKKHLDQQETLDYAQAKLLIENWYDHYNNFKKYKQLFSQYEAKEIDKLIHQQHQQANILLDNLVAADIPKIKEAQNILKNSGVFTGEPDGKDGQDTKKATADYLKNAVDNISKSIINLQELEVPQPSQTSGNSPSEPQAINGDGKSQNFASNKLVVWLSIIADSLLIFTLVIILLPFLLLEIIKKVSKINYPNTGSTSKTRQPKVIEYLDELKKLIEALQRDMVDIKPNLIQATKNNAFNSNQQMLNAIQNIEQDIQQLSTQLSSTSLPKQPSSNLTATTKQIEDLKRSKQQVETELSNIKTQLSTAESTTNSLAQQNQQLTQQNGRLTQEIETLKKQLEPRPLTVDLKKSKPIASVSVTVESADSNRHNSSGSKIRLNSASGKSYSVIQHSFNYYLVPNSEQMTYSQYSVAQLLFDCSGYEQGVRTNFSVERPATVKQATDNSSEWVLEAKGQLSFY